MAYKEEGNEEFEKNFFKISNRYIKDKLKIDLIILIPFGLLGHIRPGLGHLKILWSIKVVRINKLTNILDSRYINPIIRELKENNTKRALLDENKMDDTITDHINLLRYILISYAFRLIKLVILVFIFSYLVGIYWYIFMIYFQVTITNYNESSENFINYQGFDHVVEETTPMFRAILLTYYSVTTLTTVGFGDYHPVSSFERVCASLMLFCGYITFSLMTG